MLAEICESEITKTHFHSSFPYELFCLLNEIRLKFGHQFNFLNFDEDPDTRFPHNLLMNKNGSENNSYSLICGI